jgi:hypothetical protein
MQRQLPALPEAKTESLALWARQINKMLQDGTIVLQGQGAGNTSVRVATTANVNLANALEDGDAIDGITLNAGDLVLVKNQSTAAQNGIYKVPVSGAASRADAFSTYDAHVGAIIAVEVGTTNAGTTWQCTSAAGGTLGTTAINWTQVGIPIAGVSNAQLADMAQATIKGRAAGAGTGDPQDLTAIQALAILGFAGNDPFTKTLLHFDGADASTTITDTNFGGSAHTWTAAGNAQIDTAQSKFGGASLLLDGTGDYVSTPDHADFALGTSDWTVDAWFNCVGLTTAGGNIGGQGNAAADAAAVSFFLGRNATDEMVLRVSDGTTVGTLNGTTKFTNLLNTGWHHVAAVRTGNVLKLFIDGVQEGGDSAFTGSVQNSAETFTVGARSAGGGTMWNGWIDEFRLSVGVARWTANFTPPASPYGPK